MKKIALKISLTLALGLASFACASASTQSNKVGTAGDANCRSCERMCEIAGDAQSNPQGVESCKADCAQSCK